MRASSCQVAVLVARGKAHGLGPAVLDDAHPERDAGQACSTQAAAPVEVARHGDVAPCAQRRGFGSRPGRSQRQLEPEHAGTQHHDAAAGPVPCARMRSASARSRSTVMPVRQVVVASRREPAPYFCRVRQVAPLGLRHRRASAGCSRGRRWPARACRSRCGSPSDRENDLEHAAVVDGEGGPVPVSALTPDAAAPDPVGDDDASPDSVRPTPSSATSTRL